jgi:hypothetical protein
MAVYHLTAKLVKAVFGGLGLALAAIYGTVDGKGHSEPNITAAQTPTVEQSVQRQLRSLSYENRHFSDRSRDCDRLNKKR